LASGNIYMASESLCLAATACVFTSVCVFKRELSLYVYMSMRGDTSYATHPKIQIPHIIALMVVIFEIYYVVHIPVIIKIHDTHTQSP
jgi:hypothetical protein